MNTYFVSRNTAPEKEARQAWYYHSFLCIAEDEDQARDLHPAWEQRWCDWTKPREVFVSRWVHSPDEVTVLLYGAACAWCVEPGVILREVWPRDDNMSGRGAMPSFTTYSEAFLKNNRLKLLEEQAA